MLVINTNSKIVSIMKKHYFPLAIAVSMLCMSCENDDTNFDNIINNPFTPIEIAFSPTNRYLPMTTTM